LSELYFWYWNDESLLRLLFNLEAATILSDDFTFDNDLVLTIINKPLILIIVPMVMIRVDKNFIRMHFVLLILGRYD